MSALETTIAILPKEALSICYVFDVAHFLASNDFALQNYNYFLKKAMFSASFSVKTVKSGRIFENYWEKMMVN